MKKNRCVRTTDDTWTLWKQMAEYQSMSVSEILEYSMIRLFESLAPPLTVLTDKPQEAQVPKIVAVGTPSGPPKFLPFPKKGKR